MDAIQVLKQIGLSDKQSAVYMALLELGQATVLEISKKSDIKRPTTYVILNELSQKGLVSRVLKNRKTIYTIDHPRKLIPDAELKLKALKETVPLLESLMDKNTTKPKVRIYEGKNNLDLAYDASFIVSGEVLFMSSIGFSKELFPRTIKKLEYMKGDKQFTTRELVDESAEGRQYKQEAESQNRRIKFIPVRFLPFAIDIGIFSNTVLITSVKQEFFTLSLESPEIAQAFRGLFEAMWLLSVE